MVFYPGTLEAAIRSSTTTQESEHASLHYQSTDSTLDHVSKGWYPKSYWLNTFPQQPLLSVRSNRGLSKALGINFGESLSEEEFCL